MATPETPPVSPQAQSDTAADQNRSTESDKRFKLVLSEGILLAGASATAYLFTFQYERGFASHFGIPPQFVNVALANVLFAAVLMLGFLLLIAGVANLFISIFYPSISRHPVLLHRATTLAMVSVFAFIPAYVSGSRVFWITFIGTVVLAVCVLFLLPIFSNRKEVGYVKKIEAQARKDQSESYTSIFTLAARRLGPNLPLAIWFLLLGVFLVESAGDSAAANQVEFLTTKPLSSNEMVLLRAYGDDLILAPFDRTTKLVQKSFLIVKVQDLKTPLTLEEVGPLTPVKSQAGQSSPVQLPLSQPSRTPSP